MEVSPIHCHFLHCVRVSIDGTVIPLAMGKARSGCVCPSTCCTQLSAWHWAQAQEADTWSDSGAVTAWCQTMHVQPHL